MNANIIYCNSNFLTQTETECSDPIYIIYQYYVDSNATRHQEMQYCLQQNQTNSQVKAIYLLNERLYTDAELGINTRTDVNSLVNVPVYQRIIGKRITYADVFAFVETEGLNGYIVFMNSDIVVRYDVQCIRRSNMDTQKTLIALLRYDMQRDAHPKLYGPRGDSQDTWIYHSRFNPTPTQRNAFAFHFGIPGCDNRLVYLASIMGYTVINCPEQMKTIHVHTSMVRNYTSANRLPPPYAVIMPYISTAIQDRVKPVYSFTSNETLRTYIENAPGPFLIPQITPLESTVALIGLKINRRRQSTGDMHILASICPELITTSQAIQYSKMYYDAFEHSKLYAIWEPQGQMYRKSPGAHDYITQHFSRIHIWAFTAFHIYLSIHSNPWTNSLRGKRVLIISPKANTIHTQLEKRTQIYGIDLFVDCEIIVRAPPVQTKNENNMADAMVFFTSVTSMHFDVALIDWSFYGNILGDAIFRTGRSAICVGDILPLYFGIGSHMSQHTLATNIYQNEHWVVE